MVSLAETHLKLLFSADTEERELQGFTLVQLLLVSTAIEPCFMDTSLLQTVFLTSLGKVTPHIFSKFNPLDTDALVLQTLSNWLSQCLFWWGLTLPRIICFDVCERKEKKVSNRLLQTWIHELCHYSLCLEISWFNSFVWTMSKCLVKYFTWLKIQLVSCECSLIHCWKSYYSSLIC